MRPLLITATTPHGVVLARPWGIALDGLLASVLWHRRKADARCAGQQLIYHPDAAPADVELPLARCGTPGQEADWHWMATFCDLHPRQPAEPDIRWRTMRTDRSRLQHLASTIGSQAVSDSSGRYQRRVIPVMAHPASTLTWRAVGDPDAIADLTADLTSIGKYRAVGEGFVSRWEISHLDDVTEWEAGHQHEPGVLGRTCPPRCVNDATLTGSLGTAAVRPPYIHPGNRTTAYYPAR
jgi:CRISPR type IV-associated protein Csf3